MNPALPLLAGALCAVACAAAGWWGRGLYEDSQDLAELQAALKDKREAEDARDQLTTANDQLRADLASHRRPRPAVCRATPDQLRIYTDIVRGAVPKAAGPAAER